MNEEKDLQELLTKKVEAEFDDFIKMISRKCVDRADDFLAEYAYEYVYKQDIVSCVGCLHFSDEDAKKLLSYKHLLDFLYDEWMYCDVTAIDALEDCILDTVKKL